MGKQTKGSMEFDISHGTPADNDLDIIDERDIAPSVDSELQDEPDLTFAVPEVEQQGLEILEADDHSSSSSSSDSESENALPTANEDEKGVKISKEIKTKEPKKKKEKKIKEKKAKKEKKPKSKKEKKKEHEHSSKNDMKTDIPAEPSKESPETLKYQQHFEMPEYDQNALTPDTFEPNEMQDINMQVPERHDESSSSTSSSDSEDENVLPTEDAKENQIKKSKEKKPKTKKEKKEKKPKEKKEKKPKEEKEKTKQTKGSIEFDISHGTPADNDLDIIDEQDIAPSVDSELQDEPDLTFAVPEVEQQGLKILETDGHSSSSSSSDSENVNGLPTHNEDEKDVKISKEIKTKEPKKKK